jgi:hypothetical protein
MRVTGVTMTRMNLTLYAWTAFKSIDMALRQHAYEIRSDAQDIVPPGKVRSSMWVQSLNTGADTGRPTPTIKKGMGFLSGYAVIPREGRAGWDVSLPTIPAIPYSGPLVWRGGKLSTPKSKRAPRGSWRGKTDSRALDWILDMQNERPVASFLEFGMGNTGRSTSVRPELQRRPWEGAGAINFLSAAYMMNEEGLFPKLVLANKAAVKKRRVMKKARLRKSRYA